MVATRITTRQESAPDAAEGGMGRYRRPTPKPRSIGDSATEVPSDDPQRCRPMRSAETVAVTTHRARGEQKNQAHDEIGERYEGEQVPPTALVEIV